MKRVILHMGLVAVALGFVPSSSLAIGAIAVAERVGKTPPVVALVTKYNSVQEASKAAVAQCAANGGRSCRVVTGFEKCGAVAASDNSMGVGEGVTGRIARNASLRSCGDGECRVLDSACEEQ